MFWIAGYGLLTGYWVVLAIKVGLTDYKPEKSTIVLAMILAAGFWFESLLGKL